MIKEKNDITDVIMEYIGILGKKKYAGVIIINVVLVLFYQYRECIADTKREDI